jgi:predicted metalloprotease with PDZ domain
VEKTLNSCGKTNRSIIFLSTLLLFCSLWVNGLPDLSLRVRASEEAGESEPKYHLKLHYSLTMNLPKEHLFEVRIIASGNRDSTLDFAMPAWSPGRYVIYNFTRNVQEFSASEAGGKPLKWTKIDKQTWRVECRAVETIEVRYRVFANDLSGTFSQLNETHANINGASVFMYVVGHKQDSIDLSIKGPDGWQIINGAAAGIEQSGFHFDNYDLLVDTPTEIGDFELDTFNFDGRTYRVVLHSLVTFNEKERLITSLKQIVETQTRIFGRPEFDHYTFIFHLVPPSYPTDGMEHLNSTQIIEAGVDELIATASHEFFHIWNVKRLRPLELGPWDYSREVYTRNLWICEGLTSYYGNVSLVRSGVWSRQRYYQTLTREIQYLQLQPGRKLMSLEQSSWDTWLFLATPKVEGTNHDRATISYYNKGEIVGLMLDLEIRRLTSNRRSLDDVFRYMYEEYYQRSRPETYYLKGRGFSGLDFLRAVNRVAGSDLTAFFNSYVSGTDEIDYNHYLSYAGLKLEESKATGSYQLKELPHANDQQRELRDLWLGVQKDEKAGKAAGR